MLPITIDNEKNYSIKEISNKQKYYLLNNGFVQTNEVFLKKNLLFISLASLKTSQWVVKLSKLVRYLRTIVLKYGEAGDMVHQLRPVFLKRTVVHFPVPNGIQITCSCSSRESDSPFWPPMPQNTLLVHEYTCPKNKHIYKI